jgi:hypothetical protein
MAPLTQFINDVEHVLMSQKRNLGGSVDRRRGAMLVGKCVGLAKMKESDDGGPAVLLLFPRAT